MMRRFFQKTIFENFDLLEHPRQTTSLVGGYARVDSFNKYIGSKFDDIISFGGRFDHGSNRNFITAFGGAGNDVIFGAQTGGAIYGQAGNDLLGTYNGYEIVRNSTFKQKISLFNEDVRTTLDGGGGNDHFNRGRLSRNVYRRQWERLVILRGNHRFRQRWSGYRY